MSSYMVFCTTNIDPKVIEKFISESGRVQCFQYDMWLLVHNTNDPVEGPAYGLGWKWRPEENPDFRNRTLPEIQPFETGFNGASMETLTKFVRENGRLNRRHDGDLTIDSEGFIVLDDRSAKDGTCLVYTWNTRSPPEHLHGDIDSSDEADKIYEWIEWRVHFLIAGYWIQAAIENISLNEFRLSRDMYFDEQGTLRIPKVERNPKKVAGLTKEEQEACPWGPEKGVDSVFDDDENPEDWEFPKAAYVRCVQKGLIKTYPAVARPTREA